MAQPSGGSRLEEVSHGRGVPKFAPLFLDHGAPLHKRIRTEQSQALAVPGAMHRDGHRRCWLPPDRAPWTVMAPDE